MLNIGDVSRRELGVRLAGEGIGFRFGPYAFRLQSAAPLIAQAVHTLYASHTLAAPADCSDFHVRLDPLVHRGRFAISGAANGQVWHVWPTRLTVGAMEWVFSWCFFRGAYHHLAVHGAAASLPGDPSRALIFPGDSGAGKSTLASTLMLSGWQLLSDEISLFDLHGLQVPGLGRPTILKGESLTMLKERFGQQAVFGPVGRMVNPSQPVAHLRPTPESVAICGDTFAPAAFVFPRRADGATPRLEPLSPGTLYTRLNRVGINYRALGEAGFHTTCRLAATIPAFDLHYQDAVDAERLLRDHRWPDGSTSDVGQGAEPRAAKAAEAAEAAKAAKTTIVSPGDNAADVELPTLVDALKNESVMTAWSLQQWDAALLLASHTQLSQRLAWKAHRSTIWGQLPQLIRRRLERELQASRFNRLTFAFEVQQLERALGRLSCQPVLLKGAAYLAADFSWAEGRSTNDVDILVSEQDLPDVEQALKQAGYAEDDKWSAADQRYFRRWLHEISPLKHPYRRTEVDVHFRLLPKTDPRSFSPAEMIARAAPLQDSSFAILDPVDRVLHSIINLARTGEFWRAVRDLWDIRCMTELYPESIAGDASGFDWQSLTDRAVALRLGVPVASVLLLATEVVGLSCPAEVIERIADQPLQRLRRRWVYRTMKAATTIDAENLQKRSQRLAFWLLEHYPMPRMRAWLDPLTWTKRIALLKDE